MKKLYEYLSDLQEDEYLCITLKIGNKYIDMVEGSPKELINASTVNMWDLEKYTYVVEETSDFEILKLYI